MTLKPGPKTTLPSHLPVRVLPVRITRFHVPRFVPRVGLPRNLFLTGSLTAALGFSKGWVRKDANLGLRTECTSSCRFIGHTRNMGFCHHGLAPALQIAMQSPAIYIYICILPIYIYIYIYILLYHIL